ncbi:hypothetical protein QBC40DRAFT_201480 [Triangularia verruculosa]|uniref:Uncharacterized protein n=1 Tax=Triangularia verruculosa TaxID=2587418 RepID=A0AAN6XI97_9PEZI|nr:hypothetical protein QBC40DRAFT_201480 [Triangularia verruculosa]
MAPFTIFKKILGHLFCFAGSCDTNDHHRRRKEQQEASIGAFLGKESHGPSHRYRRKMVPPKTTHRHVTDAGHQSAKSLPTTPQPLAETTPATRSTATTSRQVNTPPPLRPYPSRPFPTPKLSDSVMSLSTLKKTLDALHLALSHTRYAVTGTAAMAIWGYVPADVRYWPRQVSILCTADDLEIIKYWAASTGHAVAFPGETNMIGMLIDGKVRGIKIRTRSRQAFEKLARVCPTEMNKRERFRGWRENILRTGAWVLGLGAMLDTLVDSWLAAYHKRDRADKEERKLEQCGRWILWILGRIAEDSGCERIPYWDVKSSRVAGEEFWGPFTAVWTEGVELLVMLGIMRRSTSRDGLAERRFWTGKEWLVGTSVASGVGGDGKGKGKEEHVSLSTVASSSWCRDSEELGEGGVNVTRLNADLARFHPDSFRVRAGLRDGSVDMRQYGLLVAAQEERGGEPGRSGTM